VKTEPTAPLSLKVTEISDFETDAEAWEFPREFANAMIKSPFSKMA
jgi:hypothetical protein